MREVRKHVGDAVRAGETLAVVEGENLSPFEIRAAFDGTVVDKHIAPGEAVTRDDAAFIVADLSSVWVIVSVYQNALAQVRPDQPVHIVAGHGGEEAHGRRALLRVAFRDNGPGLSAEQRQSIFEPFYTTKPKGTGLGMAIARRIVEAHGGRIEVSSSPGEGSTFTVTLPREPAGA